jgi:hypothetical protein
MLSILEKRSLTLVNPPGVPEMLLNLDDRSDLRLLGWDEHQETDKPIMIGQRGKMTRRGLENLKVSVEGAGRFNLSQSPAHVL